MRAVHIFCCFAIIVGVVGLPTADAADLTLLEAKELLEACKSIERLPSDYIISFTDSVQEWFPPGGNKVSYEISAVFAGKGDKILRNYKSPTISGGVLIPEIKSNVYVFDGTKTIRDGNLSSNGGVRVFEVSVDPEKAKLACASPVSAMSLIQLSSVLEAFISGKLPDGIRLAIADSSESKELTISVKSTVIVGVFRTVENCLAPMEVRVTVDDTLVLNSVCEQFLPFAGGVYPSLVNVVVNSGSSTQRIDNFRVDRVSQEDVNDSLFKLSVPEGAFVYDMDIKRTIRSHDLIQRHLDKMTGPTALKGWTRILLLNIFLVFCVGALIVIKLFRRRDVRST